MEAIDLIHGIVFSLVALVVESAILTVIAIITFHVFDLVLDTGQDD